MARDGMGQDHTRVASSVDKEDAPRCQRANRASTCAVTPCASTPHSDAGVESRIAVPVSRGIYREQTPTSSPSSLQNEGQKFAMPSTLNRGVSHGRRGVASEGAAIWPSGIKVVGEAQAKRPGPRFSTFGSQVSMGPSQGVGRVNQIELVDCATYREGVCREGCPPPRPCDYRTRSCIGVSRRIDTPLRCSASSMPH